MNHNAPKPIELESIDIIFKDLKNDPEYYSHGAVTYEDYQESEMRLD
jgi:hypothetical protein